MHGGTDNMGLIIILILVGLFFLWIWTGGPAHQNVDKPFIKIDTSNVAP
jgi:hypothetical protein